MNHSASREFLDGDKKFGLDRIGAKTLDDWRPHWTGSEQPQAGWGFVQYLERQSIGRSQNSPQAVLDYLLRKTDSSLPAIWSQEFRAICALDYPKSSQAVTQQVASHTVLRNLILPHSLQLNFMSCCVIYDYEHCLKNFSRGIHGVCQKLFADVSALT